MVRAAPNFKVKDSEPAGTDGEFVSNSGIGLLQLCLTKVRRSSLKPRLITALGKTQTQVGLPWRVPLALRRVETLYSPTTGRYEHRALPGCAGLVFSAAACLTDLANPRRCEKKPIKDRHAHVHACNRATGDEIVGKQPRNSRGAPESARNAERYPMVGKEEVAFQAQRNFSAAC